MPEPIQHPQPHGNQLGDAKRVRLCGGPFIDPNTMADLKRWQEAGASYGVAIDRLTVHANSTGFDPVSNTILKTKKRTTPKS